MAIDQFSPRDPSIHSATLEFGNRQLELEYHRYSFHALILQARMALILGLSLWLFYSLLDYLFVPYSHLNAIWNIRLIVICTIILVFITTFRPIFEYSNQQILMVLAVVNAGGLLVKMSLLPEVAVSHYFPGLILIIFWSHNFSGMRFIFASFTSMAVFITFNLLFIVFDPLSIAELLSANFYIVASITLAVCASYL